jgi:oligopeptidase B
LQYGYGSYGHTIDPYFLFQIEFIESRVRFAIAHVRGGEYYGREWYDQGKMFQN